MASKKIIIGSNQLLITDSGEIIKAKKLLDRFYNLIQWDKSYSSVKIKNCNKKTSKLYRIGGAQGRTLTCGDNISLPEINGASVTISSFLNNMYQTNVLRYYPLFGNKNLSDTDIDLLAASLSNIQNKRPNAYLNQPIPLYLSKLDKISLSKIIKRMFLKGYIKHLDQTSKDLLIILLGRLGIYFDAQAKQSSDNITGSIKLCESKLGVNLQKTKKENVRLLNIVEEEGIEITFENNVKPVLGSFLCQIN